jgi:hypothetical protein
LSIDEEALEDLKRLDGCYVIKTDVPKEMSNKEEIHARYKDLAQVRTQNLLVRKIASVCNPKIG